MNLVLYIERVVYEDVFHDIATFASMSTEELRVLKRLALPYSFTEHFCNAIFSLKRQQGIDVTEEDDEDGSEEDERIQEKICIPSYHSTSDIMIPGMHHDDAGSYFSFGSGMRLYLNQYDQRKNIVSDFFIAFEKERLQNCACFPLGDAVAVYKEMAIIANVLDKEGNPRSSEYVDLAEGWLTTIEAKSNIPSDEATEDD